MKVNGIVLLNGIFGMVGLIIIIKFLKFNLELAYAIVPLAIMSGFCIGYAVTCMVGELVR